MPPFLTNIKETILKMSIICFLIRMFANGVFFKLLWNPLFLRQKQVALADLKYFLKESSLSY